jgi:hypothetical protein
MPRLLIAVLLAAPFAFAQEGEKKAGTPCDLASVEDGAWCPKCRKVREKEQLAEEKCKDCQTAVEKVKVCVKKWIPRCGMHNQQPHLEGCCKSKFCCKFETVKLPLTFKCEGCGEASRTEGAVSHKGIEHAKRIVRTCEGSGTQPHGGDPIK